MLLSLHLRSVLTFLAAQELSTELLCSGRTRDISMGQAVKSTDPNYYYIIRAQRVCMTIPQILKTKIFIFFTLLVRAKNPHQFALAG